MDQTVSIAIISASAVLSGVVLSAAISIVLLFLNRRHQKQMLLRQKYEEMFFHFSGSLQWIQDLQNSTSRAQLFSHAQDPLSRKALTLCLLYFPDIVDKANAYIQAESEYYGFVVSSFDEAIPINAGGQVGVKPEYEKFINNLAMNKNELENCIVAKREKYIKS